MYVLHNTGWSACAFLYVEILTGNFRCDKGVVVMLGMG